MAEITDIEIDLTVEIGQTRMSMAQIMRLGRGSVIALSDTASRQFDSSGGDHPLTIRANGQKIANGKVLLRGEKVCVEISG